MPFAPIVFNGKVYYGTESEDNDKVIVLGPLEGARVVCINTNVSATTNNSGEWTLTVNAPRQFIGNNYDEFILEASGTSSPSVYPSGNYISQRMTVRARPGDNVQVRDFLLYKHKEE